MHSSDDFDRRLLDATKAELLAHKLRLLDLEARYRIAQYRSHFDPNQPRVPRGHHEGGQWTRIDGYGSNFAATSARQASLKPQDTINRQNPRPTRPEVRYAATRIKINPEIWTGFSTFDNTTKKLINILADTADTFAYVPGQSRAVYGTLVHVKFAAAVRRAKLPGIGPGDVETTFSLEPDARYGLKGSIRTDVVLRNDGGDIIAIYDVKTGGAELSRRRVQELLTMTGAAPGTPVIQLHLTRGPSRKAERMDSEGPTKRFAMELTAGRI